MRVPELFTDRPAARLPARLPASLPAHCPPEIVFLGSSSSFSDNLIQATSSHLRDQNLMRLASLADLADLGPDTSRWIRLLLVDDVTLTNTPPAILHRLPALSTMTVALAFSDYDLAARRYGAQGPGLRIHSYIPLNVGLDVWLSLVKLVLHGGKYVPEELLTAHHDQPSGATPAPAADPHSHAPPMLGLTDRQYAVLELVAAGLPNKTIATRLGVSDHTVKLHIHNIIARLGVSNRTEAAARFYDGVS